MFTGIIEGLGTVAALRGVQEGRRMTVTADFELTGTRIGDSIAVNGACLTAVAVNGRRFEADLSPETLARSTFATTRVGQRVNLERALRLSDRLDGHLVSGHIDACGEIRSVEKSGNAWYIAVDAPGELMRYVIEKGSVAVDGISLTVNACGDNGFSVTVIPHTAASTTIGFKQPGDRVNLEVDMIGKYVERFVAVTRSPQNETDDDPAALNRDFLARHGFL
jgi:riboflavin synthase